MNARPKTVDLRLAMSRDQGRLRRLQARLRDKPEDAALRGQFDEALAPSLQ